MAGARPDGKEYKPETTSPRFARFVKENPAHVEAIEISLNRPRGWSTEALGELRQSSAPRMNALR